MAIDDANLIALVRLLDESDAAQAETIIEHVAGLPVADRATVHELAAESEPAMRNAKSALVRGRFRDADSRWSELASGSAELERGLEILAGTAPEPVSLNVSETLDAYAEEVGQRLSGDRAFDEGLKAIRDVLHGQHGLCGNADDYYAPANSYLASVLQTGVGIPISLCTVAILVGRRLELPVHGIGAPGHFLGFYGDPDLPMGSYFDAFDAYRRLNSGEVKSLIESQVGTIEPAMLRPISDRMILARFLNNLANAYRRAGDTEQVRNLERWHGMLSP